MEIGFWKLVFFILYLKVGWWFDEGGGDGRVENKGFMSLFKSRMCFGVGVYFFGF